MKNMTPEREHELAEALEAFTDPTNPEYDYEFDKKIRAMRPDWFENDTIDISDDEFQNKLKQM